MQRKTRAVRSGTGGELVTTAVAALDNLAAVWAEVDKLQPEVLAVKPAGSFTIEDYISRYKVPRRTADGRLDSALRQKNLTRVRVCLPDKIGRMVPQWCYSITRRA